MSVDNAKTTDNVAMPRVSSSMPADVVRGHDAVEISVQTLPAKKKCDALIVGAFTDATLSPTAQTIETGSKGRLSAVLKAGDLGGKAGAALVLYDVPAANATRVVLVSLGPRDEFNDKAYIDAIAGAIKALESSAAKDVALTLAEIDVPGRSLEWRVQIASRIVADSYYQFAAPKQANGKSRKRQGVANVALYVGESVTPALELAVRRGRAVAEGMALAKDLGNLPGNICHPPYLADTARALAKEFGMEVEVLEREDMERLGMGSALSVGRGSEQPCKFIVLKYTGSKQQAKPIVLIGKGVTFDTGGVSLKPGEDLDMMKYDMCGAASVLGVMKTAARVSLPINLVGIIGAVENMPSGKASRPGDVVVSMSGQSIEILNTDAEGRLVLCDCMTYAERFDPDCVIDIATLTGACVIALGVQTSGLFANDDELAKELYRSGTDAADRAWRMPLWDEYQDQLKSNFADMSNLGGRPAGAVTAACFLARFAKSYKWAHLDIAGTASIGGERKGATGRPVPLLSEFLWTRADAAVA